jgi:hypothetical protein
VNVRILEIDGERRRLSLSLKRVEEGDQPVPRADGAESVHVTPDLMLSEEAFPTAAAPAELADEVEAAAATEEPTEAAPDGAAPDEVAAEESEAVAEPVAEAELPAAEEEPAVETEAPEDEPGPALEDTQADEAEPTAS